MNSFKNLGLSDPILQALTDLGFETPSDIQSQTIPTLLSSRTDLIGLAQTGTGKTAAFGLPLIQNIDPGDASTQALVLAPTRELGQQIAEQLNLFRKYMPKVNILSVYGGAAISNQIKALKKPQHIIIATPGRLLDLINRKAIKLGTLKVLVLDEADEMLNMGFKEDLDKILSYSPTDKLTWLFSATMPKEIQRIVNNYMSEPVEVSAGKRNEVNPNIEHQYSMVKHTHKTEALCRFLDMEPDMRGLVFCRTKRDTQNLAEELLQNGYRADAIHGDLSQARRDEVMKRFKAHQLQVLCATDVAARGIDVNDLTHVFHYSLPDDAAYYTHRSGRTARAGKKGISLALITQREMHRIHKLQKQLKLQFTNAKVPVLTDISANRARGWAQDILRQNGTAQLDQDLLQEMELLFAGLSKEELIAKLVSKELTKLSSNGTENLNAREDKSPSRSKGKGKGKGKDKRSFSKKFKSRQESGSKGKRRNKYPRH